MPTKLCPSCGSTIAARVEHCSECGADVSHLGANNEPVRTDGATSGRQAARQLSEPTGGRYWEYAVAAMTLLWTLVVVALAVLGPGTENAAATLGLWIAWIGLPISLHHDQKYVRVHSSWNPVTSRWVLASLVPVLAAIVGYVYLLHRRSTLASPG